MRPALTDHQLDSIRQVRPIYIPRESAMRVTIREIRQQRLAQALTIFVEGLAIVGFLFTVALIVLVCTPTLN